MSDWPVPELDQELITFLDRMVRLSDIPEIFGVKVVTVKVWRSNAIAAEAGREGASVFNSLPPPAELPPAIARLAPGPFWDRRALQEWGRQTGRLAIDNSPQRLSPPGRRRGRRAETETRTAPAA